MLPSFLPSILYRFLFLSFLLSILLLARSYEMDGQGKENRKPDGRIEARVSFYNAFYIYIYSNRLRRYIREAQ